MRYKFRYLSSLDKFKAVILGFVQNFSITMFVIYLIVLLLGKILALFGINSLSESENFVSTILTITFGISFVLGILYWILKKGVFVYDDRLILAKYTFVPFNFKPRITVNYYEIESVNVNYYNIAVTKYRYSMVTLCGDKAYNVELTLKNGKKYFFSIENQEQFVEELIERVNVYRHTHIIK